MPADRRTKGALARQIVQGSTQRVGLSTPLGLLIDTIVCLTLAKWETVSGQFGGYLKGSLNEPLDHTCRCRCRRRRKKTRSPSNRVLILDHRI
jgi:hypothetical protein